MLKTFFIFVFAPVGVVIGFMISFAIFSVAMTLGDWLDWAWLDTTLMAIVGLVLFLTPIVILIVLSLIYYRTVSKKVRFWTSTICTVEFFLVSLVNSVILYSVVLLPLLLTLDNPEDFDGFLQLYKWVLLLGLLVTSVIGGTLLVVRTMQAIKVKREKEKMER